MKNLFGYIFAVAALFSFVSCGEKPAPPKEEEPELMFPTTIVKSVDAGETVDITFNAAESWEVTADKASAAWFWIDDNGIKAYSVKGPKGSASIRLVVSDEVDFDNDRVCVLTIKMFGKTAELAKITKKALSRRVTVNRAKVDADGMFAYAVGGGYEYESYTVSSLDLLWPAGSINFELPIRVTANFDWSIKNTYPAWVEPSVTSGKSGEAVEIMLRGINASYPEDKASGTLSFMDVATQAVASEVAVNIPGYRDIVFAQCRDNLEFNVLGQYNSEGNWSSEGAAAYVTAPKNVKIIAFAGKDWVKLTPDPWDEADPSTVQTRRVSIKADENKGEARISSLAAFPAHLDETEVADLFGNVKPDYKKYVFATLNQAGFDPASGFNHVSPANSEFVMAVRGASFSKLESADSHEVYELRYNNSSSFENADLILSEDVKSVKSSSYDIQISYPSPSSDRIFRIVPDTYEEFTAEVQCLDASSKVIAVVKVVVDNSFWPVVEFTDIRFMMQPEHATLEKLTSGSVFDKYQSLGIPMYKLSYATEDGAKNAMFYVPPFNASSASSYEFHPADSWLGAEYGEEQSTKPYLQVSMNSKNPDQGKEGYIVIKAGDKPILVIVCERNFLK